MCGSYDPDESHRMKAIECVRVWAELWLMPIHSAYIVARLFEEKDHTLEHMAFN
jgi:hypothetical protein